MEPACTALSSRPGPGAVRRAVWRGRVAAVDVAAPVEDMGNTSVAIAGTEGSQVLCGARCSAGTWLGGLTPPVRSGPIIGIVFNTP